MKSRRMRWAVRVARMGEERRVYKVLVGNSKGKKPFGRLRHRGGVESEWIFYILSGFCEVDSLGSG
jgi:hypothetical protein